MWWVSIAAFLRRSNASAQQELCLNNVGFFRSSLLAMTRRPSRNQSTVGREQVIIDDVEIRLSASLQPIADLVEPRMRAAIVELGPGRTSCADRTDDLVSQLDHHAAAKEHDMWQLG